MNFIFCFLLTESISGRVFNIDTDEPLQAHLYLEELNQIFICDSAGRFLIKEVPPGDYNFVVSHIGFGEETLKVEVLDSGILFLSIGLKPIPIVIDSIKVTAPKPIEPGAQIIINTEFQLIPGAEKDIFRAIQTLPGVTTPSDYLGLAYVRGGDLYENLVIYDNVEVLAPYHYFGVGSAFNTDLIQEFEFYNGVFPARYGGAISSVLNIKSKDPEAQITGAMSIDLIEADWLYNCPIDTNLSFIFSSKRNYLDLLLKNIGIVKDVVLPYYLDHQGKVLINSQLGNLAISGLKSTEGTNIETAFANETIKLKIEGNGNSVCTDLNKAFTNDFKANINLFYTEMERNLYGAIPALKYSETNEKIKERKYGLNICSQFDFNVMKLETGGGLGRFAFIHQGQKIEDLLYGTKFFEYSFNIDTMDNYKYLYSSQEFYPLKPLVCELGQRIDWLPVIKRTVFSPRIRFIYDKKPVVYLGYGHHHQIPPLEYNLVEPNSIYARSLNFGFEQTFKQTYSLKIEFYIKRYHNLVTQRFIPLSNDSMLWFKNDAEGYASGLEIFLRKFQTDDNFGWISYAFSSSKRATPYDSNLTDPDTYRPHIFNLVMGKNLKNFIRIGIKINIASGNTSYEIIGKRWNGSNWEPVYAPEKSRIPSYQRADLHLQKDIKFWGFVGEIYLAILNLTNHRNIQGYLYNSDWTLRKAFYMMPRIPLIGFKLKF